MDPLITAAARLHATGNLLGALKRVALRDDVSTFALRGIVEAQPGNLLCARTLLRSAASHCGERNRSQNVRFAALRSPDLYRTTKRSVSETIWVVYALVIPLQFAALLGLRSDNRSGELDPWPYFGSLQLAPIDFDRINTPPSVAVEPVEGAEG
jgi:hypothetical protein